MRTFEQNFERVNNAEKICTVSWNYPEIGKIELTFENHLTGAKETRTYKTVAAAKAQETRFINRAVRVYG